MLMVPSSVAHGSRTSC